MWLLVVYPTAFFLVAGYTESLALAFALACFLALRKRQWIWAGVWAALTTLTRQQGILLIAPILCVALGEWWQTGRKHLPNRLPSILVSAALPALAFLGFGVYIHYWIKFPWPWETLTNTWNLHSGLPWNSLYYTITFLIGHLPGTAASIGYNYTAILGNLILLAWSLYWLIAGRKLPFEYQVYAWLMLIVPMFQIGSGTLLRSLSRYTLSIFPLFIVQAQRIHNRWVFGALLLVSAAAQLVMLVAFYQWIWVA
jgi:Gpi18-like mannosyltransferase